MFLAVSIFFKFILLPVLFLWLVKFIRNYIRFRSMVNQLPGPQTDSFWFGNLKMFWNEVKKFKDEPIQIRLKATQQYISKMIDQYRKEGVFRLWFGPSYPIVLLTNADNVERLLSSTQNVNKAGFYRFFEPWLGDGLLLATGSTWRPRRKILTSAFHFKILQNFISIFSRHTEHLLQGIDDECYGEIRYDDNDDRNNGKRNGKIYIKDVRPMYEDFTLNIIKESAMGIELDDDEHGDGLKANEDKISLSSNQEYCSALKHALRRASNRLIKPISWFDLTFRLTKTGRYFFKTIETMNNYSDAIIRRRSIDYLSSVQLANKTPRSDTSSDDENQKNPKMFLDILLRHHFERSPAFKSPKSVRSEVNTFIIGGHDTTAMALTFATMLLGNHQAIQDRVREEIKSILDDNDNNNKELTMQQLKSMPYLEQCIKETLRLYPSVRVIARRLSNPLMLSDETTVIPANTECFVPIYDLHRDERYFPEPEVFDPDRFAPGSKLNNLFAYIPFSAGPRNCIGQKYAMLEIKYVLAKLIKKYRIYSLTKQQDVFPEFAPVFKPSIKISVIFEPLAK